MNNKELTELKERFMSAYCEPNKLHHKWGYKLVDGEYYQYSPDDVWAWIELTVLPHLKSNDEIKREAEYRTTYAPILEKSAVHRFIEDLDDRTIYDKEELLGIWAESYLTQKETQ